MYRDQSTGMTPTQLAYSFGFRACIAGKKMADNPHLLPGEIDWRPSAELGDAWLTGWLNGQGKSESDLAWHEHVSRGGD